MNLRYMSKINYTPGEKRRNAIKSRIIADYEAAKATQTDTKGRPVSDTQIILQMMNSGKYGYCSMQSYRNIINAHNNND